MELLKGPYSIARVSTALQCVLVFEVGRSIYSAEAMLHESAVRCINGNALKCALLVSQ